jgi:dUTP pyrophosphatase
MPPATADIDADQVEVLLQRLDPLLPAPGYAHPGDAGADLMTSVDVVLAPGERRTVPTGVAIALPIGFAAFVHPRSGLAARSGLTIVNAPGTVDAGYRGEISVTLLNTDRSVPVHLRRGDRIAQLVVQRVTRARFVEVEDLPDSVRGSGGFGSTGGFGTTDPGSVDLRTTDLGSVELGTTGLDSQKLVSETGKLVSDDSSALESARGQGEI